MWIKEALARDRKKSKSGLAAALGIDPSSVTRLLRGERHLKFAEAQHAAAYLGVEPPTGFAEEGDDYQHQSPGKKEPSFAPLFRMVASDGGYWVLDRTDMIERKPRNPQLAGISSAFGFYIPNNVMAPRFKTGEIAWVNPVRPVTPGDDALLIKVQKTEGRDKVLLCELREIHDDRFVACQHGEGTTEIFARDEWVALHVFSRA